MKCQYRNTFPKILVVLFTTLLVGCTCLPFSSPSSKTPIIGAISYSDIVTYIEVNASGNPKWDGWIGITNQDQTLNYSITPSSPYVEINKDTGEITVLANVIFSNSFIVTATGYGEFQDSVSATLSVEVVPPFLYNVANVKDNFLNGGARPLAAALIGKTSYVFIGSDNGGVGVFSMQSDGSLVNVAGVVDSNSLKINIPYSIATALVGETNYLFVTGYYDDGLSVFSVGDDGSLNNVYNVSDDNNLRIKGALSLTTSVVGGTTYLFVGGYKDHGLSVFSVGDDGSLNNVYNVGNNNILKLSNVESVTTALVGNTNYLFVGSFGDDGISVFSIEDNGSLNNVVNVSDDDVLELKTTDTITTFVLGGTTYLLATGFLDHGMSMFSVNNDGTLVNITNISDNDVLYLRGTRTVAAKEVKGTIYIFVIGSDDDGVSVFSVGDDGSLINVDNVSFKHHNNALVKQLQGFITTQVGETSYLVVTGMDGSFNGRVSVFSIHPEFLIKMR